MAKILIKNPRGQPVGIYDTDGDIYVTHRDAHMEQVFYKKFIYKGFVGISDCIIRHIAVLGCRKIMFIIHNWDILKKDFLDRKINYVLFDFGAFADRSIPINYSAEKLGGKQHIIDSRLGEILNEKENIKEWITK